MEGPKVRRSIMEVGRTGGWSGQREELHFLPVGH